MRILDVVDDKLVTGLQAPTCIVGDESIFFKLLTYFLEIRDVPISRAITVMFVRFPLQPIALKSSAL
jgi:hypothetical protein